MIRVDYGEYLKSPYWRAIRRRALALADHRCERCGWRHHLEVHHLTYERLGHELPQDLEVLCSVCHALAHDLPAPPREPVSSYPEHITNIMPRVLERMGLQPVAAEDPR